MMFEQASNSFLNPYQQWILAKMASNKNFWDVLVSNNQLDIFEADDYLLAPTSTNFHTVETQSAQTGIPAR